MFQFRLLAASVTAAGLLAAMPAAAAVKIATYSGIVGAGFDQTGIFAAPGSDLTGYSWVATFAYDTTLAGDRDTDGVNYDYSYGGLSYGSPGMSPIISASITINGVTRSVAGTYAGSLYTTTSSYVQHFAQDYSYDGITETSNYIYTYHYPAGAPGSLDQNFGPVAAVGGYGYASWYAYDSSTSTYINNTYAYLGSDAVYSVGAVPEPANWAMMIAGFGLVGTALRRRRAPAGITA